MEWLERYGLFLFDFDGLLVNTEHVHQQAYELLAEEMGYPVDWDFATYCGLAHQKSRAPIDYFYQRFPGFRARYPDPEQLYERKCTLYQELLNVGCVTFMPGASALLSALADRKIPCAVVTHGRRAHIHLIRSQLPALDLIPHWLTREDYQQAKPHPEGYLTAISRYGGDRTSIVGFEDSARGVAALCQTPAQPVLVCSPDYPLLAESMTERVLHLTSLQSILHTL